MLVSVGEQKLISDSLKHLAEPLLSMRVFYGSVCEASEGRCAHRTFAFVL